MRYIHKMDHSLFLPFKSQNIFITIFVTIYNIIYNTFFLSFWLKKFKVAYIILIKKKIFRSNYIFYNFILVFSNQSRFFSSKPRVSQFRVKDTVLRAYNVWYDGGFNSFFLLSLSTKAIAPLERINPYNLNNVS